MKKFLIFYGSRATRFRIQKLLDAFHERKDAKLHVEHFPVKIIKDTPHVYSSVYHITKELKPEAGIVCADRFETLAAAMGITYAGYPLIHLQGGDISGTLDDRVRHAVTKLADYHFPYSDDSAFRLYSMREPRERIYYLGDPAKEYAIELSNKNNFSNKHNYLVSILHPDFYSAIEEIQLKNYFCAIRRFARKNRYQVYHFYPNPDPGSKQIREFMVGDMLDNGYKLVHNMDPQEFIPFLCRAKFIVGNSSVAIREAGVLKINAINVGKRQNGRTCMPNVAHASFNEDDLLECMNKILKKPFETLDYEVETDYKSAGRRIVDKIISL